MEQRKRRSVKQVGARPRAKTLDASRCTAKLRWERRGSYFKFAQCFDGRGIFVESRAKFRVHDTRSIQEHFRAEFLSTVQFRFEYAGRIVGSWTGGAWGKKNKRIHRSQKVLAGRGQ